MPKPLAVEPLLKTAGVLTSDGEQGEVSYQALANQIGVTKRAVVRWVARGNLPWYSADEAAVKLGFDVYHVWGRAWDEAFDKEDDA